MRCPIRKALDFKPLLFVLGLSFSFFSFSVFRHTRGETNAKTPSEGIFFLFLLAASPGSPYGGRPSLASDDDAAHFLLFVSFLFCLLQTTRYRLSPMVHITCVTVLPLH